MARHRGAADRKSGIRIAILAGLFVLAAGFMLYMQKSRQAPIPAGSIYMVDLASGNLHAADKGTLGPDADGRVNAFVFGCGSCDVALRSVAYVARYTNKARTAASQRAAMGEDAPFNQTAELDKEIVVGTEVASWKQGAKLEWVPIDSEEGRQVVAGRDPGCREKMVACFPGSR